MLPWIIIGSVLCAWGMLSVLGAERMRRIGDWNQGRDESSSAPGETGAAAPPTGRRARR